MIRTSLVAFLMSAAATANAYDFLAHGAMTKSSGGAGVIQSNSPSAVLYNPARLSIGSDTSTYAEVSFLKLSYLYDHPDFDAASVEIASPIIFLGSKIKVSKDLTFGLAIMPIPGGVNKMEIKNIPSRQLSEQAALIDISTVNQSGLDYELGAGMSYRLFPGLNVGLSIVSTKNTADLQVIDSESQTEIISTKYSQDSNRFNLGFQASLARNLYLGLNYEPMHQITTKGKFENDGGQSYSKEFVVPQRISFGTKYKLAAIVPYFQGTYSQMSKASGDRDPLNTSEGIDVDLFDTFSWVLGSQWNFARNQKVVFAYGLAPTAVGSGVIAAQSNDGIEKSGITFGNIDAISRETVSLGYQHRIGKVKTDFSLARHHGERSVPEYSRGYGEYSLDIILASGAVSYRF